MNIFWFRRDLRLNDNIGLHEALKSGKVHPIFIFDEIILDKLEKNDSRLNFIYETLEKINLKLSKYYTSIKYYYGNPSDIWLDIIKDNNIDNVYWNKDYEPYALKRDCNIQNILDKNNIQSYSFKDQVIFEESEILKNDGTPYTIYTPYKNKWLSRIREPQLINSVDLFHNFIKNREKNFKLSSLGFIKSKISVKPYTFSNVSHYHEIRDYPAKDQTSYLSPHLRFGTISVRECVLKALKENDIFLSELIWREFFKQIIYHFPYVINKPFKEKYNKIKWINNSNDFKKWKLGLTGYPMVDAGMRQLNQTGYMHNRVRMITASFLVKHLLIDWRLGEAYFAKKLLDYDLSANNGNWQWAAGTGCDSAPYFRIFNPIEQLKKFDTNLNYVHNWVKDFKNDSYPEPMIDHKLARQRCLETYKIGLNS